MEKLFTISFFKYNRYYDRVDCDSVTSWVHTIPRIGETVKLFDSEDEPKSFTTYKVVDVVHLIGASHVIGIHIIEI